ncbi:MAG: SUMF1/EgtB/PvdO family nonheme iron enzyme [Lentisphaeria bacterium]|nr:SUMF1/EgtB/PvdO family nonheme iron enzyme [Lentisphaeria bacterium]
MSAVLNKGDIFSGCRILAECGKGAYGVVYLAENAIGQKIVIKLVTSSGHSDREFRGLKHYIPVSGTHPNLLQVFHVGKFADGFYYTMEAADNLNDSGDFYRPATLGNMLREGRKFSPEYAVRVTRELLGGVSAMHRANLVHRDIKPDNIIFVNGKAKLSDPGLVTEAGQPETFAGTPGFIPPECIADALPATPGNDLYALGKVFYCMVTGNPPGEYPHLPENMRIEVRRQLFPSLSQMCNTNPAKRFTSAEEFLKSLPETIKNPSFLERKYSAFRDWKILNREKFRFFIFSLLFLLLIAVAAAALLLIGHTRKISRDSRLHREIDSFMAINRDRKELVLFQLEVYLPELSAKYLQMEEALAVYRSAGKLASAADTARKLHDFLRDAAGKLLPEVPAKLSSAAAASLAVIGKARGFMSTPLFEYLPDDVRKQFRKKVEKAESSFYSSWSGPRCSQDWDNMDNYEYPMVFVPPGAVKMAHNNKTVKIPYHFWIAKNETSHAHFTRLLGISPQRSPHTGTPVERVLWNDFLFYCRILTDVMKRREVLPEGYIVRPPTEAEWEYAANNAWLGKDTSPLSERAVIASNSGRRTMPAGSKKPGKLGINDIYGNVAELVLPLEPPAMQHAVIMRGGSFLSGEKDCYKRTPVLKYQNIPYSIGIRPVIAPGDPDYFDRHFFNGGATSLEYNGRIFELIGENYGCFEWRKAEELCRLMGGRLAELDSPELLKTIIEKMPLAAAGWECFIGGRKNEKSGKWHWISSGKEVDSGSWYKNFTGNLLALNGRKYLGVSDRRSGIFICQWDAKEFQKRNAALESGKKMPCELLRFSIGNRRYMLINSNMAWYTARRVCELLGGRLASPDTPELSRAIIEKLTEYSDYHILLGGYAKQNKWFWLSGTEYTGKLKQNKDHPIATLNRNFITLKNGDFYNSQYSSLFLCEWLPDNSLSN